MQNFKKIKKIGHPGGTRPIFCGYPLLGVVHIFICVMLSSCASSQIKELDIQTSSGAVSNPSYRKPHNLIRVGLVINEQSANIKAQGKFEMIDTDNGDVIATGEDSLMQLMGSNAGIFIGNKNTMKNNLRIVSKNYIEVNGKRYRGKIFVKMNNNGKLTVIDELSMEEYLYGVVPLEISSRCSFEALRAQAIASRTYAYHQKLKNKDMDYDLTSTIYSQVYGGVDKEKEVTNNAVDSTVGMVLVYKNEIIYAAFHSNCGGYTEDSKSVWNTELPYLQSIKCGYCRDSPHYKWGCEIAPESIRIALRKSGYSVGRILDIKVLDLDRSGRISSLEIDHADGELTISGAKFRMAIGPNIIKSANFKVKTESDISGTRFVFSGRGWGHGVGLCQDGASGMAESGYSYKRILEKYYPGTDLVKIK